MKCEHKKLYYGVCENCGEDIVKDPVDIMTNEETNINLYHDPKANVHACVCNIKEPVASNTGKELKSCPFCGKDPGPEAIWAFKGSDLDVTSDCDCILVNDAGPFLRIETWNNAWAHQKIASLESSLEGMKNRNQELEKEAKLMTKWVDNFGKVKTDLEKRNVELERLTIEFSKDDKENSAYILELAQKLKTAEDKLATSEKECEEQARLNGMGSEREAALMAQLAAAAKRGYEAATKLGLDERLSWEIKAAIDRKSAGD